MIFIPFDNQFFYHICVHPYKVRFRVLLFEEIQQGRCQNIVHQQNIIAFVSGGLYEAELRLCIGSVEVDQLVVLIGLRGLNQGLVLVPGEEFMFGISKEEKFQRFLIKFLICQHSIFNEKLQIVPFFLQFIPFVFENLG